MTTATSKMKCLNCGAEMNHHADKIVYVVSTPVEQTNAPVMDGLLQESHSCPACGSAASRLGTVAL